MFSFNPELAQESDMDDGDEAFDSYAIEDDDDEGLEYKELDLEALALEAQEADDSGTIAKNDRLTEQQNCNETDSTTTTSNGTTSDLSNNDGAVPINENLFLEEDLDGLDAELDDLDIEE